MANDTTTRVRRGLTLSIVDAVMVHMARKASATQSAKTKRTSRRRTRHKTRVGTITKLDAHRLRTARELLRNVKKYTPIIQKKLRAAGVKTAPASLYSVAMYYPALDRLAKE